MSGIPEDIVPRVGKLRDAIELHDYNYYALKKSNAMGGKRSDTCGEKWGKLKVT